MVSTGQRYIASSSARLAAFALLAALLTGCDGGRSAEQSPKSGTVRAERRAELMMLARAYLHEKRRAKHGRFRYTNRFELSMRRTPGCSTIVSAS